MGINGLTLLAIIILIGMAIRPHHTLLLLIILLALIGAVTLIFQVLFH